MPTRREFLFGSTAAITAVALYGAVYKLGQQEQKIKNLESNPQNPVDYSDMMATLINGLTQSVVEAQNQNITPSPTATIIVESVRGDKATATPTSTSIPEANQAPQIVERRHLVGEREVNPWDGGWSVPAIPSMQAMVAWFELIDIQYQMGNLTKGDIRTFERMKELSGSSDMFIYKTLQSRLGGINISTITGPKTWVPSYPTTISTTEGDINIDLPPLAYQAPYQLLLSADDVLKSLGNDNPSSKEIRNLASQMQFQLFSWGGNAENTHLATRNTLPKNAQTRALQPESTICSVYVPNVEIGQEYINSGILHQSNMAPVMFEFALDITKETSAERPDWVAVVPVTGKDGRTYYWKARMFDLGSRPHPDNVFGFGGVPDPDGSPWASQIMNNCGPSIGSEPTEAPQESPQQSPTPGSNATATPEDQTPPPNDEEEEKSDDPYDGDDEDRGDRGEDGNDGNDDTIPGQPLTMPATGRLLRSQIK